VRSADHNATDRSTFSRRQLLGGGLVLGSGLWSSGSPSTAAIRKASATMSAGSDLGAIEHVIFLMQENRSFDHYFGSYKGVRGFDDHPVNSLGVFAQPYADNTSRHPTGYQLPFRLDTGTGLGECTRDLDHDWRSQHLSWNGGAMDGFAKTHASTQFDGPANGLLTMGYHTRADLPFHYALADAFTICDAYHCSIMGPTHPNRLMAMSGSIDPAGHHGGPILTTNSSPNSIFSVNWTTVPELLEDAGVSWKTYTHPGEGFLPKSPGLGTGDSILQYFRQYSKPSSPLFKKAFLPTYPADFIHDVKTGKLPRVSWIIPPDGYDEHPPAPPAYGAWFIDKVLRTLISNPKVWSKTALFITYDENDGFFDHVPPPVAPPGTPGEYVTKQPLPRQAGSVAGPIGLGFRVPMLVVSPFSRGGYVSSETFDHTSQIRFLEERFGIRSSEISAWRRQSVGDLTSTLRMKRANMAKPRLPSTYGYRTTALTVQGCTQGDVYKSNTSLPLYPMAAVQSMPTQEAGTVRRLPGSAS
jgi:phospholipase C